MPATARQQAETVRSGTVRRGTVRSMWSRAGSTAGGTRGRAVDEEGRAGVFLWRSAGEGQAASGGGGAPYEGEGGAHR